MFQIALPKWIYEAAGIAAALLLLCAALWFGVHEHDRRVATEATAAMVQKAQAAQAKAEAAASAATATAASESLATAKTYQEHVDALTQTNASLLAAAEHQPAVVRVPVSTVSVACASVRAASARAASTVDASTISWALPVAYSDALFSIGSDADTEVGALRAQIDALKAELATDRTTVNGQAATP